MTLAMAPKQKGGQKPKTNTAEEVEETFQAVVWLTVAQVARLLVGYRLCFNQIC
jgi:hypothetical protein